jgi:hypothetical protein
VYAVVTTVALYLAICACSSWVKVYPALTNTQFPPSWTYCWVVMILYAMYLQQQERRALAQPVNLACILSCQSDKAVFHMCFL